VAENPVEKTFARQRTTKPIALTIVAIQPFSRLIGSLEECRYNAYSLVLSIEANARIVPFL